MAQEHYFSAQPAGDFTPRTLTVTLDGRAVEVVTAGGVFSRARELTMMNAERLGLDNVTAVAPEGIPADLRFTSIWSNPPIRIGKGELHGLLDAWLPRLDQGSDAWLVVARNLGSDSLQRWMESRYAGELSVTRASTNKGYRVLRVRNRSGLTGPITLARG